MGSCSEEEKSAIQSKIDALKAKQTKAQEKLDKVNEDLAKAQEKLDNGTYSSQPHSQLQGGEWVYYGSKYSKKYPEDKN